MSLVIACSLFYLHANFLLMFLYLLKYFGCLSHVMLLYLVLYFYYVYYYYYYNYVQHQACPHAFIARDWESSTFCSKSTFDSETVMQSGILCQKFQYILWNCSVRWSCCLFPFQGQCRYLF